MVANRRFGRLSLRCRVLFIVFATITLPAELMITRVLARKYYYLNVENLQLVALAAAKTGVLYLPADPGAAIREADAYAKGHGIARAEIISTELSSDNRVLTITVDRKIPRYIVMLVMGALPARDINVTASAWRQSAGHTFDTQTLDVPTAERWGMCLLSQGQRTETLQGLCWDQSATATVFGLSDCPRRRKSRLQLVALAY